MAFGQLGNGESSPQPMSEINMTPLVDVMLVLLIIFIVTAPLLTHNIKVNLPQAAAKASSIQRPVVVTLDRQLRLYLEGTPVSRQALHDALVQAVAKGEPPTVQLQADGAVPYQDLIQVMALVQQAGVSKLSFVTMEKKR